jgi:alkylation response protein AidB-like acyl-CoA dehydrogenase
MIRDSVAAVFPATGSLARVRELRFRSPGHDPSTYREMCAMGWSGLRLSAEQGGSGLQLTELCALAQGLGAALVPEPIVATAILAPLVAADVPGVLADILSGACLVAPAWAERANGLGAAPQARFEGGKVSGTKRFVPAGGANAFVVTTAQGPVLVRRDAAGVTVDEQFTQDGGLLAQVRFDNAVGTALAGDFHAVQLELTLANAATLQGVIDRMLEITLEYVCTRRQFGRPIGSFQALQHRMVDLRIEQELARAVLAETVATFDASRDDTTRAAAVSRAAARLSHAAITSAKQAIQLHGAIGMTDECDLGLYARKALALYNRFGSASAHRKRYMALHGSGRPASGAGPRVDPAAMPADYNEWPDDAFRAHVKQWVEANYPPELRHPLERLHRRDTKPWYERLVAQGWLAPGWPREWGGMGLDPGKQVIFQDVLARHGCARFSDHGVNQLGPLIMNYASKQQKEFFLPKIMTGEHIWCQGYSEPNSGSDLASLRTEAVLDGDEWVINGQKIWTTLATDANWIYLLVRTDKAGKKQAGISFLLVPMDRPGITVRPILTIGMTPEFCEVFFDNVRVPRDSLVGEMNQGWQMAKALLGFERLFVGSPPQSANTLAQLDTLATDLGLWGDSEFRDEYAKLLLELRDHESLYQLFVDQVCRGEDLGADVSMLKIHQTELYQRITQAAIDFGGEYAALRRSPEGETAVTPAALWIQARVTTIYGGTSEIQRNIIAKNVLRLPEGP